MKLLLCVRSLATPEIMMMQVKCTAPLNAAYFFPSPVSVCISSKKTVHSLLWWLSPVSIL